VTFCPSARRVRTISVLFSDIQVALGWSIPLGITLGKDMFARIGKYLDQVELLLFRIALLVLFIIGLVRIVRAELGW
jgi:hypothetical protein